MEYKLTMPRLTDTMEVGKIVRWLKKEGDTVEENEPIVEVESDKAVMDIPSFKSGIVEKILHEEGEEVPVGEVIAIIETDVSKAGKKKEEESEEKVEETTEKKEETSIVEELLPISVEEKEEPKVEIPEEEKVELPEGTASPSAKKLAKELGIDLKKEQEKGNLPTPAHEKDIKEFYYSKFFSKKALELAKEYELDLKELVEKYGKKITEKEVKKYVSENNIPLKKEISSIQKSLISSLSKSVEIPVFHIFEDMDTSKIPHDETATLTVWILKIIGDTMQLHDRVRAKMEDDNYLIYPNSNISVAIAVNEDLYAPVVKNVNQKNLLEIKEDLANLKQKAQENKLSPEDLTGATFALSNLGMFDIKSFDAIIPPGLVGIVATGREIKGTTSMTFSFDHRIINGREAALFVVSLKEKFKDKKYLEKLKKEISK
jgi:pyruvate dehydrogenase E2 component (dihydrolipoamide acetyltransferase)